MAARRASERSQAFAKQRREASVYDAVAGRVTSEGFVPQHSTASKFRDTESHSQQPSSPEEVLFRRKKARPYYGDSDPYWGRRGEEKDRVRLPDSDLLKAIHAYASDFYANAIGGEAFVDYQSLDESALLGLGMLLEEMADEVLGETGDLAFTEGVPEGEESRPAIEQTKDGEATKKAKVKNVRRSTSNESGSEEAEQRRSKRRRVG